MSTDKTNKKLIIIITNHQIKDTKSMKEVAIVKKEANQGTHLFYLIAIVIHKYIHKDNNNNYNKL